MKPLLLPSNSSNLTTQIRCFTSSSPKTHNSVHISTALFLRQSNLSKLTFGKFQFDKPSRLIRLVSSNSTKSETTTTATSTTTLYENVPEIAEASSGTTLLEEEDQWNVHVGSPSLPPLHVSAAAAAAGKFSLGDQGFFLLSFIACMTTIAFTSLVIAAVPTLYAMGRAATSLSKLLDTAREELPSTMAAIRLSGMEISDLTLELSDLSQEIAEGVSKSSQAVQAAEAGIQQIGSLARQQTISIIQERASLPIISLQPIVVGAAKKTSRAVGEATKTLMNMISQGKLSSEPEDTDGFDRLEI